MAEEGTCTEDLISKIKAVIRKELSARHVPGVVDECPGMSLSSPYMFYTMICNKSSVLLMLSPGIAIPVTTNGKKVEVAVKQILCGMNVKTSASVANAECLEWYRGWNKRHP